METTFTEKGFFNQHLKVQMDNSNINNGRNADVFSQILVGNVKSSQMDYLLNLGYIRLNDTKSIGMFNELNIAANKNKFKKYEEIVDNSTLFLPKKFKKIKKSLEDCLEYRQSIRTFFPYQMSLKDFSTLCKYSFGQSNRTANYNGIVATSRYYASGGGLYPVQVYIYANNVSGVKKGIYRYQLNTHSLYPINEHFDTSKFLQYGNFDFDNFNFLVMYEYDINKTYLKYGELSLLNVFVEAGIISHNFELVCSGLDFSACQIAGFDKPYADAALNCDGVNSHVIFTNICGKR